MCLGIWFVLVGYTRIAFFVAMTPPAQSKISRTFVSLFRPKALPCLRHSFKQGRKICQSLTCICKDAAHVTHGLYVSKLTARCCGSFFMFGVQRTLQVLGCLPEKQRGMEIRNQRAIKEKKAPRGIAPLLPVPAIRILSKDIASSVIPGKKAATLHATAVQPSYDRFRTPHNQMLAPPAATASKR